METQTLKRPIRWKKVFERESRTAANRVINRIVYMHKKLIELDELIKDSRNKDLHVLDFNVDVMSMLALFEETVLMPALEKAKVYGLSSKNEDAMYCEEIIKIIKSHQLAAKRAYVQDTMVPPDVLVKIDGIDTILAGCEVKS